MRKTLFVLLCDTNWSCDSGTAIRCDETSLPHARTRVAARYLTFACVEMDVNEIENAGTDESTQEHG